MEQQWSPRKWHGVPGFISWPSTTPMTHPSQHAVHSPHCRADEAAMAITAPQHFLYFLPLPQGHGSLRPTSMGRRWDVEAVQYTREVQGNCFPLRGKSRLLVYLAVLLSLLQGISQ